MIEEKIHELLRAHPTGVLASVAADGTPEAAAVGFSHDPNDMTLLVGTNCSSRKFANLQKNPNVALVIGIEGQETLQYEGTVVVAKKEELDDRLKRHFAKVPRARRFENDKGQTYLVISPTWIRYTNYELAEPIYERRF